MNEAVGGADEMNANRPVRVLSIDGGGIRGLIPARLLVELERMTGRGVGEMFDIIAGTSTGGIIALGLAKPGPHGRPEFSAARVMEIYSEYGPTIFPSIGGMGVRRWLTRPVLQSVIQRAGAVARPRRYGNARYVSTGLESLLHEYLGGSRLSDAVCDVIVPAYDWKAGRPIVFRSREAHTGEAPNPLMRDVARATSAAPTYFPPLRMLLGDREEVVLIDGGLAANNPVSLAYHEFLHREEASGRDLDVLVVSLGTGTPPAEIPTYQELWSRSWLSLGMGMLNVAFDGTSEIQDEVLHKVVAKKEPHSHYVRFQPELRGCSFRTRRRQRRQRAGLARHRRAHDRRPADDAPSPRRPVDHG